ncbi:hypothetical protein EB796_008464 [Bugula neritina]|uniref:Uncharacterized protein n=1 Tax=Bugula neritina TaxID=10212 RepID=A0A7J7K3M9_BUGNE|nr:hypothetical protein EB796_008464 [Bugula neritina]
MFQIKAIEDQTLQLMMEVSHYEATVNNELVDFAQQLSSQKSSLENVRSAAIEVCDSEIDLMVKQYTKTVNSIKTATNYEVPTYYPTYRQIRIGKNELIYCESVIAFNLSAL